MTVYKYLEERGALDMLKDELMEVGTRAISEWSGPGSQKKERSEVRSEVRLLKKRDCKRREIVKEERL